MSSQLLLLHCDGTNGSTTFTNNGMGGGTVTAQGGCNISTAQYKFTGASGLNDGVYGSRLVLPRFMHYRRWSFEGFFRFSTSPSSKTHTLAAQYANSGNFVSTLLRVGPKISLYSAYTGLVQGSTSLAANTWYHIAFAVNGSQVEAWLDGTREINASGYDYHPSRWCPTYLGDYDFPSQDSDHGEALHGYFDEIRILVGSQVSYTGATITVPTGTFTDDTSNPSGYPSDVFGQNVYSMDPVIWLRFDEASGTTANDASGNGRDGTYVGTPTLNQTSPISGQKSVLLDAAGDYVTVAYHSSLQPTMLTAVMVLQINDHDTTATIAQTPGWKLRIAAGILTLTVGSNNVTVDISSGVDGDRYLIGILIVGTGAGKAMLLSADNTKISVANSAALSSNMTYSGTSYGAYIGTDAATQTEQFVGVVDEFAMSSYVDSATRIADLIEYSFAVSTLRWRFVIYELEGGFGSPVKLAQFSFLTSIASENTAYEATVVARSRETSPNVAERAFDADQFSDSYWQADLYNTGDASDTSQLAYIDFDIPFRGRPSQYSLTFAGTSANKACGWALLEYVDGSWVLSDVQAGATMPSGPYPVGNPSLGSGISPAWSAYVYEQQGGSLPCISEIDWLDEDDVSIVGGGAGLHASSPGNITDSNLATVAAGDGTAERYNTFGAIFTTRVTPRKLVMTSPGPTSGHSTSEAPKSFIVQYLQLDTETPQWFSAASFTAIAAWTAGESRTFDLGDITPNQAASWTDAMVLGDTYSVREFARMILTDALAIGESLAGLLSASLVLSDILLVNGVMALGERIGLLLQDSLLFLSRIGSETDSGAWVVNLNTGAVWRYTNYGAQSFATIGDTVYAAIGNSIYELDGDTDDGTEIEMCAAIGRQDFGTSLMKGDFEAYLGVATTASMALRVTANGETFVYEANGTNEWMENLRCKFGKGLKSRYVEIEVVSRDPALLDLDSVELRARPLSRRL